MRRIENEVLAGERALFGEKELEIVGCTFQQGESPLKEARDLDIKDTTFEWKYPLWYVKRATVKGSSWQEMARAGVWYSKDIVIEDCHIEAPKNFRRCKRLTIRNTDFPNAQETLWANKEVTLENVTAKGDYFAMNCKDMVVRNLRLDGNYSFDGVKNVEVHDSYLMSKDAFWNSDNVTVYNSYINGEYLGWNSENLTLIDCEIDSLQGLCYIKNLVMKNCRLKGTSLAFEYVENCDAEIVDEVDSVINPISGMIRVPKIGELILETDRIDPARTVIECPEVGARYDKNIYQGKILEV